MLKIGLLSLGLITGSLFAQDNNTLISSSTLNGYSVKLLDSKDSNLDKTSLDLKVYNRGHLLKNENVELTIYSPNHEKKVFKNIKFDENKYHVNSNINEKGNYKYVVKFSNQGSNLNHYLRGNFSL